ncbi:MAG: hypothetical protein EZS28_010152 [Streblomastix strix]|uniref:Tyr recombinase domain-containing protein n=1 Tax=Streblomastix strix TaxID=222440 RepID=A0A5J4WHZ1_9EUKA|nr:MAG: hypothetical protein EZS28_010152 [Streblomastix strix]
MLVYPPIEQLPRAITKVKRDRVIALFILPDWVLTMYYQTFPTIIAALNLKLATHVLQEGKKMKQLQLKLPPGDLIAELINTLEENQFTMIQGGYKLKQRIRKFRIYGCAILSQFSEMKDISKSPLINQFSKNHQLAIEQKAKNNSMWNIQFFFNYIEKRRFKSLQEMQAKIMSLLVAFSAASIVELARMMQSDTQINDEDIFIQTSTTKWEKLRLFTIKLTRKNNNYCPVTALQIWKNEKNRMIVKLLQLWWNFAKQKPATSDDCSHILLDIIKKAGIPEQLTGSSIRHAMMIRLRAAGASQQEVNSFICHALNSTVVDIYYHSPIARDLSKLLIQIDERYSYIKYEMSHKT